LLASAWLSAAWLAGAGCASAPKEEQQVASKERACANDASDPLHMASSRPDAGRDPQIESILNQRPDDPRLAWVNRQMYQTLHALDVELRREQRIDACEHPESNALTLQAQADNGAGPGGGGLQAGNGAAPGGGPQVGAASGGGSQTGTDAPGGMVAIAGGGGGSVVSPIPPTYGGAAASAPAAPQNAAPDGAASAAAHSTSIRKASLSANGGGGNGATAPKLNAGSDNDVVARRLRKAAEQETNPTLRTKLWKEYADYKQGLAAK
jgi:hypothetical protein